VVCSGTFPKTRSMSERRAWVRLIGGPNGVVPSRSRIARRMSSSVGKISIPHPKWCEAPFAKVKATLHLRALYGCKSLRSMAFVTVDGSGSILNASGSCRGFDGFIISFGLGWLSLTPLHTHKDFWGESDIFFSSNS